MLAPLLLLWPMSVVLTWLVAQGIANRPFDRELGEMVRVLAQQVAVRARRRRGAACAVRAAAGAARDPAQPTTPTTSTTRCSGLRGEFLGGDRDAAGAGRRATARRRASCAFATTTLHDEPVRVAYLWRARRAGRARRRPAPPLVQVAETLGKRSRLATEIIKGVILPQFVILPLAVLLVWLALARGIAPLNELQQRIRQRDSNDLSPIDEREAPEEVSPLVRAINDLLARLDQSIGAQKHFLADAAHQLKTPLAGPAHAGRAGAARDRRRPARPAGAEDARCSRSRARASARRTWSTSCWRWRAPRTQEQAPRAQAGRPGAAGHRDGARLRAARAGEAHRPRLRGPGDAATHAPPRAAASRCCCAS